MHSKYCFIMAFLSFFLMSLDKNRLMCKWETKIVFSLVLDTDSIMTSSLELECSILISIVR